MLCRRAQPEASVLLRRTFAPYMRRIGDHDAAALINRRREEFLRGITGTPVRDIRRLMRTGKGVFTKRYEVDLALSDLTSHSLCNSRFNLSC